MVGADRESEVKLREIQGHHVIQGSRFDRIEFAHSPPIAARTPCAYRLRLNDADEHSRGLVHGVPRCHQKPGRTLADVDSQVFGDDGTLSVRLSDLRRPGGITCWNGDVRHRRYRPCAALFDESISEELLAHETDDLLPTPDMVPQKIRDSFKVCIPTRDF